MDERQKIFDALEVGEKVTFKEVKENTYIRQKKSLKLLSSKRIKTELVSRDHRQSQG